VGHAGATGLVGHVAVELLIDDVEFVAGEHGRVLERVLERRVVEQKLAPYVRADHGEVVPPKTELFGQLPLQWAHRAFA
jgi:hypothetical protein